MSTKVKVTGQTKVSVKRKPVKAGSTHTNTTGGIFTTKVVAIERKRKKKQKKDG